MFLALSHPGSAWIASVGIVLLVILDEGSVREMARRFARQRTRKVEELLAHAKTALHHAARSAASTPSAMALDFCARRAAGTNPDISVALLVTQ